MNKEILDTINHQMKSYYETAPRIVVLAKVVHKMDFNSQRVRG
jgi:hypothetical protein